MATAFRKMGVYLGLVEDDDYADGDESYGAVAREPQYSRRDADPRMRDVDVRGRGAYDGHAEIQHSEVYEEYDVAYDQQPTHRITTLHPRTYNEAKTIGLQFRDGTPVIMNLTEMDDADAKRLVDFAAGLTFGLHGSIERVTPKVFLLSPNNVTVTAADKQRIAEGGFYNQS
jgi:cell division inhibitor SepF